MNETETKYDAPAGAGLPRLDRLPRVATASGPEQQRLEAEYYDTDDLRLLRAGITLRQRSGGGDAGWHLKLPLGHDTRREIRRPLNGDTRSVPAELAGLVRVHTRGAALRPVARMTTTRQRVILLDDAGKSLAEVAADDVSAQTLGQASAVSRWQEVEVELTGGDRQLLKAADDLLRHHDGLRPAGRAAKLARALGDRLPKAEDPARPTASSPAGQVVLAYLRAQAGTLTSLDPLVRLDEPDSVHQMRVASRRLRSTLRSFGRILSRDDTSGLAAELKWLGGVLGAARDGEVLATHLRSSLRQVPVELRIGPVEARIQGHFASVSAAARTELLAALDSDRYFFLLDDLDRLLAEPPLTAKAARPATDVLPAAARHARRQAGRRMDRAWHAAPGQARNEALHRARKSARRARYAAEAMSPAVGGKASRFAKRMKRVQSVLGEHQDSVIARRVTRDLGIGAHLAGENAFSYGLLYERDACDGERFQAEARRIWKKAAGKSWPG
ncbi:MAG TPA: CYTH and CHAD domain-containing protein [Streptosporangiaceae bacterium]|nr:CYTH and CHAD domain-containing protein [Streptosporangiaceae bacterium]